jgi:hypothetical protein
MDEMLSALQWPAMVATLLAAWFVASRTATRRKWGFWVYLLSNLLWGLWGWHEDAHALIALQVGLFAMNVRGAKKNEDASGQAETSS